ncbi:hypothetical protein [Actinomadura litoris]|uniref:hypothetical protein n=1 Tax=Actinomadura litoris TaxID=2678616 RepID=UPI001FA7C930|nr:hypothetical protein [Actinomadura litoris]
MELTTDQVNQIISIVSGLLTILVGALVRHYLPPRDGRPDDPDPSELSPPSAVKPTTPKEDAVPDE